MNSLIKTLAPLALVVGVSAASAQALETSYPEGFIAQPSAGSVSAAASGAALILLNNQQGVLPAPFVSTRSREEVRREAAQPRKVEPYYFQ